MKFIIVDSFDQVWNGKTARTLNGVSGTHCSMLYLAEGLAMHSNNVVEIVSTKNNIIEDTYLNVTYTNINNFEPIKFFFIISFTKINH
jgi:hypothetical protein